ncbi:MAG: SOS response-associated peptidase [Gemmataceae bacterium]
MCGRFTLYHTPKDVAEQFDLPTVVAFEPRYNIAPTQQVLAVRATESGREAVWLRWGLIPSWAGDASIGARLLNARVETILEKPSFRVAFQRRRCLIPADGFYEWQAVAGKKQPLHFSLHDGRLFAFAGLWEQWTSPEGVMLQTCTVLTTAANALIQGVHDRMPVLVDKARYGDWLSPKSDPKQLPAWLTAWPAEEMRMTPANPRVNNARNEGRDCLARAD